MDICRASYLLDGLLCFKDVVIYCEYILYTVKNRPHVVLKMQIHLIVYMKT